MGLDMYLSARRHINDYNEKDVPVAAAITAAIPGLEAFKVSGVRVEIGYWRKANAIHRWFVENVQDGRDDCQESWVDREDLEELLELVKTVEANPEQAEELLPATSGFFFGSTEYDEGYRDDLCLTRKILEQALNSDVLEGWDFYYQASW